MGCLPHGPNGLLPAAVQAYLHACFAHESPPRVSELAQHLGVSRGWLIRQFMLTWGTTPSRYLKDRQLERAMALLRGSGLSGKRVGYQAAFGTRRTFFRSFHVGAGLTPAQFREAWRERQFSEENTDFEVRVSFRRLTWHARPRREWLQSREQNVST